MSRGRTRDSSAESTATKPGRRAPRERHATPGPPGLIGTGQKAKNFKTSFRRLVYTLRPERTLILIVIAVTLISVVLQIAAPKIMARATDDIFAGAMSREINQQIEDLGFSPDSRPPPLTARRYGFPPTSSN